MSRAFLMLIRYLSVNDRSQRYHRNDSFLKILISGASIAGPAPALWLVRYGFDVTIVEKASEVRPGSQAVDFKGATHRIVLERMARN